MATAAETGQNIGHVTQVIGSTFDVEFSEQLVKMAKFRT